LLDERAVIAMVSEKIEILDYGYVQLIESWGSDERIIESARMSTNKGFLGWGPKCRQCGDLFTDEERDCPNPAPGRPLVDSGRGGHVFDTPGDEKLLKYLWDHAHSTPFEFAGLIVEIKAPIMVFREHHRHRTQSYSERSARYTPLPDENYIPSVDRVLMANQATTNKQAQGSGKTITEIQAHNWLVELQDAYIHAQQVYERGLALGVPKELARLPVPVGRYSVMRASANVRNWCGFLKLRCDTTAQWEIRQFANAIASLVKQRFPRTYDVARESLGLT
jgi:thymidylate synthase (FAD)